MFGRYSDRARRVIFLSRKIAGRRGAAEIGVEDLIEALVVEDQGDFLEVFSEEMPRGAAVPVMPKHPAFFNAEAAAEIRRELQPLLVPSGKPLADSVDMPLSEGSKALLEAAKELSDELDHQPETPTQMRAGHVGPLHLLAAVLSDESCEVAKILRHAGTSRAAAIAAIRSGESAE